MITLIPYQFAFLIASLAFVYTNILTQPDQLFAKLYKTLDTRFKNDERMRAGKGYHPLFMVLIHCEKCVAGQLALWLFLFYQWHSYDFVQHILFIAFTILVTHTIKESNQKLFQ